MRLLKLKPTPCRWLCALLFSVCFMATGHGQNASPLVIGISAEFGLKGSHSAQAIERGARLAIDEINQGGGVLGGRKLVLETRDDLSLPARSVANVRQFAANPDVLAVFCGRYSSAAADLVPLVNREGLLLLNPWAAADAIANNGATPNYVFRLSMTDSGALGLMTRHANARKFKRVGLLLPNNAWGRSSLAAFLAAAARYPGMQHTPLWYNFGDQDFSDKLLMARQAGAQAILMVANEAEGGRLVQQIAALPEAQRLPIISHWGITGGDFPAVAGPALRSVDLVVAQTFRLHQAGHPKAASVAKAYKALFGEDLQDLKAAAGFVHAYDLTHLLAMAIRKAGSAERAAVRGAMENLGTYAGLLRTHVRPFTPTNHDGLDQKHLVLSRFNAEGKLVAASTR